MIRSMGMSGVSKLLLWLVVLVSIGRAAAADSGTSAVLDPRGEIHIPIGIANTLDSLKTFVEAEGDFSPGVGTYGVYFWLYDKTASRLFAPTRKDVSCEHGLAEGGYLLPWAKWSAGDVEVKSELCHVLQDSPQGRVHVVGGRTLESTKRGFVLPAETKQAHIQFGS